MPYKKQFEQLLEHWIAVAYKSEGEKARLNAETLSMALNKIRAVNIK